MNNINEKLIDFISAKYGSPNEILLYLLSLRHNLNYKLSEEGFRFLQKENLIKLDLVTGKIVSTTGLYEGEEFVFEEVDTSIEKQIRERIDEYRSLFKGVRSGSIGQKQKVIDLLIDFCHSNQKTFDEVLEVTKVYMSYTDFNLISNADNFISKIDHTGKEVSLLTMAFEEQDMKSVSEDKTYKIL